MVRLVLWNQTTPFCFLTTFYHLAAVIFSQLRKAMLMKSARKGTLYPQKCLFSVHVNLAAGLSPLRSVYVIVKLSLYTVVCPLVSPSSLKDFFHSRHLFLCWLIIIETNYSSFVLRTSLTFNKASSSTSTLTSPCLPGVRESFESFKSEKLFYFDSLPFLSICRHFNGILNSPFQTKLFWQWSPDKEDISSGYLHINKFWRGLPSVIDAAIYWSDDFLYFFRHNKCVLRATNGRSKRLCTLHDTLIEISGFAYVWFLKLYLQNILKLLACPDSRVYSSS